MNVKKIVFKFLAIFVLITMLVCLVGCGEDSEAKGELKSMFSLLCDGKYTEAMEKYVAETDSGYDFLKCGENFNKESFATYDMNMAVFESLKYSIESSKVINESEIHFKVKLTTLDLTPVGKELAENVAAYNATAENAGADEKLSDDELNAILSQQTVSISEEYLSDNDIKKRTSEVEIAMYYDPIGKWFVHIDDNLIDALTGGVYTAYYDAIKKADMVKK